MIEFPSDLPEPPYGWGTEVIENLLRDKDSSYKFLWLLAILDEFSGDMPQMSDNWHTVSYAKLAKRMLERAHLLIHHYELKLGTTDKRKVKHDHLDEYLITVFQDCGQNLGENASFFDLHSYQIFWSSITFNQSSKQLNLMMENVPWRSLSPFLDSDKDYQEKEKPQKRKYMDGKYGIGRKKLPQPPLYTYCYNNSEINIDTDWCYYLYKHNTILCNWVMGCLRDYLAEKNSDVPGIEHKLASLDYCAMNQAKHMWQQVNLRYPSKLICPYSKQPLADAHVINHFIPHSFVHHNQPWNLVPTTLKASVAKSNRLPSLDCLDTFMDMQHLAIDVILEEPSDKFKFVKKAFEADIYGKPLSEMVKNPQKSRKQLKDVILYNHRQATSQGYRTWQPTDLLSFK